MDLQSQAKHRLTCFGRRDGKAEVFHQSNHVHHGPDNDLLIQDIPDGGEARGQRRGLTPGRT